MGYTGGKGGDPARAWSLLAADYEGVRSGLPSCRPRGLETLRSPGTQKRSKASAFLVIPMRLPRVISGIAVRGVRVNEAEVGEVWPAPEST